MSLILPSGLCGCLCGCGLISAMKLAKGDTSRRGMSCLRFRRNTMTMMSSMCRFTASGKTRLARALFTEARRAFFAASRSLCPCQIPSATRRRPSRTLWERRVGASRACGVRSSHLASLSRSAALSRALWSCSGLPGAFRASRMRSSFSAGLPLASIWRTCGPWWPGDLRSVMLSAFFAVFPCDYRPVHHFVYTAHILPVSLLFS